VIDGPWPAVGVVIFDLDGVLADSAPSHARAFDDLWQRIGIPGPPYASISGLRTTDVIERETNALAPAPGLLTEWVRFKQARAREYLASHSTVFPDALRALESLTARGRTLAVATGSSRETAAAVLAQGRLTRFFQAVVTGDDVGAGKPDPEIFLRAIAATRGIPDRTLVVEDSAAGLVAADRSGAWSVTARSEAPGSGPRWLGRVPDLAELVRRDRQ